MRRQLLLAAGLVLVLSACSDNNSADPESSDSVDLLTHAHTLALRSIIIDTHIDVPDRLRDKWADVSAATETGDFDYPRAVAGGLNAPFMSIYTDAKLEALGESKASAEELIDLVYAVVEASPDKFAIALSPADIEDQFARGLMSLPMGMENGSPIEGSLTNLQYFYDRGIRYITLAHSLSNHISDSSYDKIRRWEGLSEFGERVVAEMNRLGIMIDVSHLSDAAIEDVVGITRAPVIASHSSSRHFTPGWERNISDDLVAAVGDNGGVIMINFGSSFVTLEARLYSQARSDAYDAYVAENDLEKSSELGREFRAGYDAQYGPYPFADVEDVLDHFDHIATLVGTDHIGVGSDFDGVGDSLPTKLKDVSMYPNLIRGLLERGYSDGDIEKMLGGNLLRVWRDVEAVAASTNGG